MIETKTSAIETKTPAQAPSDHDGVATQKQEVLALKENEREKAQENAKQEEMSFGLVYGKSITKIPENLYIPPDALEVFLEAFEGPLDLLLYLIRRQNIDILEIDVASVTTQYMQYVETMQAMQFELAAEYLLMAALLAEIKSRMLLPRQTESDQEEEDPRANLIMRLLEYERFKEAAEAIDAMPRQGRDNFKAYVDTANIEIIRPTADIDLQELVLAFSEVLHRSDLQKSHMITPEKLSTRARMTLILERLAENSFVPFITLFNLEEGRLGVVVTFLALMELIKDAMVDIVQSEQYGAIHIKAR